MMRKIGQSVAWLTLALLLSVIQPSLAQKPKGKPSSPPPVQGSIFLARVSSAGGVSVWGLKADGSGLTQVLPGGFSNLSHFIAVTPSDRVYGSDPLRDRWWISMEVTGYYDEERVSPTLVNYDVPHLDLFAIRTNPADRTKVEKVQLTDFYGRVRIQRMGSWDMVPYWSNNANEGLDSYVIHPQVLDIRDHFIVDEDGRAIISYLEDEQGKRITPPRRMLRLPVSGSEIQAGWLDGNFVPFGPDYCDPEQLDFLVDSLLWPGSTLYFFYQGMDSPDGQFFVRHQANAGYHISAALAPTVVLSPLDNPGGGRGHTRLPQWSPDGMSVMLIDGTSDISGTSSDGGDIYLQPLDASHATPLLKSSTVVKGKTSNTTSYFTTKWSSDSKYLVARSYKFTNGKKVGEGLVRVSAADGSVVDLKVDTTSWHLPLRCVSNTPGSW